MKLKICGMREAENIAQILPLQPDYLGFIRWEPSARYIDKPADISIPESIKKVGVFVDADADTIRRDTDAFEFDFIQLHGKENPEFCMRLADEGYQIIKAFGMHDRFEFSLLEHYKAACSHFLFDTKGRLPGGNGQTFNWNLLRKYETEVPFFLSGGIAPNHADFLASSRSELTAHGIDINSRFESEPGVKNIDLLKPFVNTLRPPVAVSE